MKDAALVHLHIILGDNCKGWYSYL